MYIGFKNGFTIRYKMSSNYNIFNNIDMSECTGSLLVYSSNGTGPEVAGAFEIVDGEIGTGDDVYADNSEEIEDSNYVYVQAAIINGETDERIENITLLDITPLSLGIEIKGEKMDVIIPKNTPIQPQR
jgi:hypothetical protein